MHNQLFTFRRCPYAIRARVALYVCDIVYEAIEVDLKHKPKKLLELSPKATVPVFVTSSGAVIDESLYIVEYALSQKLPEGFVNVTTKQYERGEAMLDALHRVFIPALNKVKYPNRYKGVVLQDEWSQLNQCLQQWEQDFVGKGLLADQYTYYDIAIMPLIRQLFKVDENSIHPYPKLKKWLEMWLSSECMKSVMAKLQDQSLKLGKFEVGKLTILKKSVR